MDLFGEIEAASPASKSEKQIDENFSLFAEPPQQKIKISEETTSQKVNTDSTAISYVKKNNYLSGEATNILGHDKTIDAFLNFVRTDNSNRCFILSGQEAIGKKLCAYYFAQLLFYGEDTSFTSQNKLYHKLFEHPDIMLIQEEEGKKEIAVESIRKIHSFFSLSSNNASKKIIIVDSTDKLNKSSSNALLKILEEPNRNSVCFLINNMQQHILPTIRSRAIELKFADISFEDFSTILLHSIHNEKNIDSSWLQSSGLNTLYNLSSGSLGIAREVLLLGVFDYFNSFLKIANDKNISELLKLVNKLKKDNKRVQKLFFDILINSECKDLSKIKSVAEVSNKQKIITSVHNHFQSNMDILDTLKLIMYYI